MSTGLLPTSKTRPEPIARDLRRNNPPPQLRPHVQVNWLRAPSVQTTVATTEKITPEGPTGQTRASNPPPGTADLRVTLKTTPWSQRWPPPTTYVRARPIVEPPRMSGFGKHLSSPRAFAMNKVQIRPDPKKYNQNVSVTSHKGLSLSLAKRTPSQSGRHTHKPQGSPKAIAPRIALVRPPATKKD